MTGVVLPVDGDTWWPSVVFSLDRQQGRAGVSGGLCCPAFPPAFFIRAAAAAPGYTGSSHVFRHARFHFQLRRQWRRWHRRVFQVHARAAMGGGQSRAVGIAEIAKATGFPRPTVHRIVAALTAERLLVEIGATRSWTLGHRLVQLASRSWSRSGLRTAARDALRAARRNRRNRASGRALGPVHGLYRETGKPQRGADGLAHRHQRVPAFHRRGQGLPGGAGARRGRAAAGPDRLRAADAADHRRRRCLAQAAAGRAPAAGPRTRRRTSRISTASARRCAMPAAVRWPPSASARWRSGRSQTSRPATWRRCCAPAAIGQRLAENPNLAYA